MTSVNLQRCINTVSGALFEDDVNDEIMKFIERHYKPTDSSAKVIKSFVTRFYNSKESDSTCFAYVLRKGKKLSDSFGEFLAIDLAGMFNKLRKRKDLEEELRDKFEQFGSVVEEMMQDESFYYFDERNGLCRRYNSLQDCVDDFDLTNYSCEFNKIRVVLNRYFARQTASSRDTRKTVNVSDGVFGKLEKFERDTRKRKADETFTARENAKKKLDEEFAESDRLLDLLNRGDIKKKASDQVAYFLKYGDPQELSRHHQSVDDLRDITFKLPGFRGLHQISNLILKEWTVGDLKAHLLYLVLCEKSIPESSFPPYKTFQIVHNGRVLSENETLEQMDEIPFFSVV